MIATQTETDEQIAIINHEQGPAIVLAGAGSGKTRVVCLRALRRIQAGVRSSEMLLLTFSRAGAQEMRARMLLLSNNDPRVQRMRIDTFHAFGYRLVREEPELYDRAANVTIADDGDQVRIFRRAAVSVGLDPQDKQIKGQIERTRKLHSYLKNWGITPARDRERVFRAVTERLPGIYGDSASIYVNAIEAYERELARSNTMDFDDLNLAVMRVLEAPQNKGYLRRIAGQYRDILVDEAQDTSMIQYRIVRALAAVSRSLMMVGDDKQSIYGFRGARVSNLMQFIREFNPTVYPLLQNFRSTPPIVEAAANLISYNSQLPGRSFSKRPVGAAVELREYPIANTLIDRVAEQVRHWLNHAVPLDQIAILYRTNRISHVMERAMRLAGADYKIVGGMSLYDTKEARCAMACARLLRNPTDHSALSPISEFCPGLGEVGLAKIADRVSSGAAANVWVAGEQVKGALGQKIAWLAGQLEKLEKAGAENLGAWMMGTDGLDIDAFYRAKMARGGDTVLLSKERERRINNLQTLDLATQSALVRASELTAPVEDTAPQEWWRLLSDDERWDVVLEAKIDDREEGQAKKDRPRITLSTIHRSKGLEWSRVMVVGFSDGLMPISQEEAIADAESDAIDQGAGSLSTITAGMDGSIEEERRLAYVAMTRAKDELLLIHTQSLAPYGRDFYMVSRFWEETQRSERNGKSDLSTDRRQVVISSAAAN